MLAQDLRELQAFGAACIEGRYVNGYRERIAVERALFNTAKHIAREQFGFELSGFSRASYEVMTEHVTGRPDEKEGSHALRVAFELAAVGAALSSGSAYARKDLKLDEIEGTKKAIRMYGFRLRRYAELIALI